MLLSRILLSTGLVLFSVLILGCSDDPSETLSKESAPPEEKPSQEAVDQTGAADGSAQEKSSEDQTEKGADNLPSEPTEEVAPVEREERLSGPVATVNGVTLDSNKYYDEMDKAAKHGAKIPPERVERIRKNILNRMVEEELIRQAVEAEKIVISKKELDKGFKAYREKFKSEDQFKNYLKHGKHTERSIRERISQKKSLEKLIDKRGSMKVSDSDITAFYEKNKMFYFEKEAVHARHILFKVGPEADESSIKVAKKQIARVQKLIKKGVDFGVLAKEFSEGPTGPKGGDLGFFSRGQMVKPFEEAAFELKPNQVSPEVRTKFGFHLIQVLERREESQKPLQEVKAQIKSSLKNKRFFQERRKVLENLKSTAKIVNNVTK